MNKLRVDDVVELKDGRIVRILKVRDESYMYPVWFVDIETGVTGGCKFEDIKRKVRDT